MIAQHLKGRTILVFSYSAVILLATALYYVILYGTTRNLVDNWRRSELVSLQQGNLLTSISKYQRVLPLSNYIEGISVFDLASKNSVLISIGKSFEINNILNSKDDINIFMTPSGSAFAYISVIGRSDLVVGFMIESSRLKIAFLIFCFILLVLIQCFYFLIRKIEGRVKEQETIVKMESLSQFNGLAQQVVHDIRAPLSALKIISSKLDMSDGHFSLFQAATKRIELIADDLLESGRQTKDKTSFGNDGNSKINTPRGQIRENKSVASVNNYIESLIHEFQISTDSHVLLEFQTQEAYKFDGGSDAISVNIIELGRALTNLVTNSIESIEIDGCVTVLTSYDGNDYKVAIIDNGRGLTKQQMSIIGRKGSTWGKIKGNGLGVYGAKKILKECGGQMIIESTFGEGTKITIAIPLVK